MIEATFNQYCRLHCPVWASNRELIRAAHKLLKPSARFSRLSRNMRHAWLKSLLRMHKAEKAFYISNRF